MYRPPHLRKASSAVASQGRPDPGDALCLPAVTHPLAPLRHPSSLSSSYPRSGASARSARGRYRPRALEERGARLLCRATVKLDKPGEEYRRNVGLMLINSQDRAFAAVRLNDSKGYWQMPQGGIDAGEDTWAAALRELHEETGVKDVQLLAEAPGWYAYDFPPETRAKLYGTWANYKGQAQKWFLVRLTGPESQIDISGIGEQREFSEWCWMPLGQLVECVVPFKRAVYEGVVAEFAAVLESHSKEGALGRRE